MGTDPIFIGLTDGASSTTYTDGEGVRKTAPSVNFRLGVENYDAEKAISKWLSHVGQGPPGILRQYFGVFYFKEKYPGGARAYGDGAGAICSPGELVKYPHKKIVPGWASFGTYGGTLPFRYVNPTFPIVHGTDHIGFDANVIDEMDDTYGRGNWELHMEIRFPVLFAKSLVTSSGFKLEKLSRGFVGKIAQSVPPGILTISPLAFKGEFWFWLKTAQFIPPTEEHLYLYHENIVASTVTPAHGTEIMRDGTVLVTATPYPFHTLESFTIRGTTVLSDGTTVEITKDVPITDKYGTTEWIWNLDDNSIAAWLLNMKLGSIQSDVYVSAVSAYTGTKPVPAGKAISIQCETNECCAPTWAITDQDAGTEEWGLSIDADGLITGFIPRDFEPGGVYGIEVTVTGPTQSTSAWVYVEVQEAPIYGTVWTGTALLAGGSVLALAEVGDVVYAAVGNQAIPGTGKVFYADKADLETWVECTYSDTMLCPAGMVKVNDNLLALIDNGGNLWTCSDGAAWVKGNAYVAPDGGGKHSGNLFAVNSSMVIWYPQRAAMTTVGIYVIDVVDDSLVSSSDISSGWNLVAQALDLAYGEGVACVSAKGNTNAHGVVTFTVNETTGVIAYVGKTLDLDAGYAGSAVVTYRGGCFYAANLTNFYRSLDGSNWETLSTGSPTGLSDIWVLSPRTPHAAFMGVDGSAVLNRTVNTWVDTALVQALTNKEAVCMIELADGTLVAGDAGTTTNLWVSTE